MKKILHYSLILCLFTISVFSQKQNKQNKKTIQKISLTEDNQRFYEEYGVVRCATVENEMLLKQNNPKRSTTEEFENWLAPKIAEIKADRLAGKNFRVIYNIPVVIHIMHNGEPIGTAPNITDAQAISQITVMNEDFRRMAGTRGGDNTTGLAEDIEINFCLAQQDESGNPTTGINRVNMGQDGINEVSSGAALAAFNLIKPTSQWDPTKYLNMWTVKFSGGAAGLLGYAQFPDPAGTGVTGIGVGDVGPVGAANTDGVVASYDAFGSLDADDGSFIMNGTYNLGRTMTHEVGHWLGLRHIWGDGGCGVDDFCADTPESDASNGGCPTTVSCGTTDQVQNYMDYTADSCMDTFTQDQKDRMQAIMAISPRRVELNSSIGCEAPSPTIGFSNSTQTINESTDCSYTDVTITVEIAKAPSANADITITNSGSATLNTDFQIIGGSLLFLSGSLTDQTFTVRIFNDSFIENDETITLGMTINANGGDATITTAADKENIITIVSDDLDPLTSGANVIIYSDDFESGLTNWTITGSGTDNFDIANNGTFPDAGAFNSDQSNVTNYAFVNDDDCNCTMNDERMATGAINLTSVSSATVSFDYVFDNSYVGDVATLQLSTDGGSTWPASAVLASTSTGNEDLIPWQTITISLDSYIGQTINLSIHYNDQGGWGQGILIDNFEVTTPGAADVQTSINSGTPDLDSLSSSGTIYALDTSDGNVMARITNNDSSNYGCVSTSVSRASGTAQMYQTTGVTNYVMDKTFAIIPTTAQAGGNATLKFYFTETEIAAWESTTGNNRSTLVVIKDNGIPEPMTTSIGSFGANITLEANFVSGIEGTYYFGKLSALKVEKNDFVLFSIYPNPTNGTINLSLSSIEGVQVSLFDIRGRLISSEVYTNNSGTFNKELNFSSVSSGVYLLNVKSGNKTATKKLIIQ